jgi:hypothetical protein
VPALGGAVPALGGDATTGPSDESPSKKQRVAPDEPAIDPAGSAGEEPVDAERAAVSEAADDQAIAAAAEEVAGQDAAPGGYADEGAVRVLFEGGADPGADLLLTSEAGEEILDVLLAEGGADPVGGDLASAAADDSKEDVGMEPAEGGAPAADEVVVPSETGKAADVKAEDLLPIGTIVITSAGSNKAFWDNQEAEIIGHLTNKYKTKMLTGPKLGEKHNFNCDRVTPKEPAKEDAAASTSGADASGGAAASSGGAPASSGGAPACASGETASDSAGAICAEDLASVFD